MNLNWKVIGIKLIISTIVVFSIFGIFYHANIMNLIVVSILTAGVSYFVVDQYILPRTNNLMATLADFVLAFATLAVLGSFLIVTDMPVILASLFAAFFLALTEPLLHAYIQDGEEKERDNMRYVPGRNLQTEFAEETDEETLLRKKDPRRDQTD
ncbi:YndM family protein [Ornithinibacillus bavariensis]|uniref:Membrane protein YndM n=1 Tax=Ornithinibacillus bavariensis TaxID=545502 RepID=A0A919X6X2_9BACI|nr:YndM family protein [Ornithinibacillus bavariensis]GIO27066.1 putative membrane protein YndM [Ornithinibacillus bavariensis]